MSYHVPNDAYHSSRGGPFTARVWPDILTTVSTVKKDNGEITRTYVCTPDIYTCSTQDLDPEPVEKSVRDENTLNVLREAIKYVNKEFPRIIHVRGKTFTISFKDTKAKLRQILTGMITREEIENTVNESVVMDNETKVNESQMQSMLMRALVEGVKEHGVDRRRPNFDLITVTREELISSRPLSLQSDRHEYYYILADHKVDSVPLRLRNQSTS